MLRRVKAFPCFISGLNSGGIILEALVALATYEHLDGLLGLLLEVEVLVVGASPIVTSLLN